MRKPVPLRLLVPGMALVQLAEGRLRQGRAADGCGAVYEVIVRHNAVVAVRPALRTPGMHVPGSNLEVTSELARNHRLHGSIDGCYRFGDPERARSFAILALDFVRRLLEQRIEQVESLDTGAEFEAPEYAAQRPPGTD